jgi:CheY-like chemotaxis protein
MNGWTLFEKIKAYDPLIPMILYSGYPEELEKASRYPIQPDFLLQKPFRAETLLKIVHSTNRQIR